MRVLTRRFLVAMASAVTCFSVSLFRICLHSSATYCRLILSEYSIRSLNNMHEKSSYGLDESAHGHVDLK